MYLPHWASWSCSRDLDKGRGVGTTKLGIGAALRDAEALGGCCVTLEGTDAILGAGGTALAVGTGAGPFEVEGGALDTGG